MTRKILYGISTVLISIILAAPAPAAAAGMTLSEAVSYAIAHSPALERQRAAVAQASAQYVKARGQQYPNVVGTLQNQVLRSANATGGFAQFGLSQQNRFSQNTAQLGTNYTLFNGGLNQITAQQSRQQYEAAKDDLRRLDAQTTTDTTAAFFNVAAKGESARLAESDLAYQRALLDAATAKERAGLAAGVDTLRAQVNVKRSQASLANARSDEQNAREALAQIIGAPLDTPFAVPNRLAEPPLPQQSVESLIAIAEANRPDLASARASAQVARLSRAGLFAEFFPSIQLAGAFGNQTSPTAFQLQQAQLDGFCRQTPGCLKAPTVVRGTPGFWQIQATTALNLPLIDYGARSAAHQAANEQVVSADANLDAVRRTVEGDVRQGLRNAQTAAATIAFQHDAARLGAESARIAQLQYQNGLISLTDTVAAQNTALSSELDLYNARVTYLTALVKLRMALGTYDPAASVADMVQ